MDIAAAATVSVPLSCVIKTALSARAATPVPPLATGSIVAPTLEARLTELKNAELVLLHALKSSTL